MKVIVEGISYTLFIQEKITNYIQLCLYALFGFFSNITITTIEMSLPFSFSEKVNNNNLASKLLKFNVYIHTKKNVNSSFSNIL